MVLATIISGEQGGSISKLTTPSFAYTGIDLLEELFAKEVKAHFLNFYANDLLREVPKILPAYSASDREFHCVVIEGSVQQISNQGMALNRSQIEYNDEMYEAITGDFTYSVDFYCRSANRNNVIRMADWVMAGLMGPVKVAIARAGIVLPANALRFSGKAMKLNEGPEPKGLTWAITMTINGIVLPWSVMYKNELPSIQDIRIVATV